VRRPSKPSVLLAALVTVTGFAAVTVTGLALDPQPAFALENGLARTPPMGFNNWNTTACGSAFNEAMVKGVADTFVSAGLKDVGYQYVNIDDCWAEQTRDASGNLVPNHTRFPNGIKAVADYVHSKGLKFGIYTSAGTKTCNGTGGFPGGLGHEQQDANLFASWGVDYLKYDNCNNQNVDAVQRYTAMRDALAATGRPIAYSITEWGRTGPPKVWEWGAGVGNLWRTTGDISDNWTSMINIAHANDDLAQFAGPGHWNDPDMLEVGNGGMTDTEYRTHFSLWAVMAAPLLIGSDIRTASAATLAILRNTDVIAVDQDALGRQGTLVSSSGGLAVYSKVLANGDRAVVLLNETAASAAVSTSASAIGLGGSTSVNLKNLWSKATSTSTGSISSTVPSHGVVMYRVSRAGTSSRLEAENATISQGVVESNHTGFSGTGFVNGDNAVGGFVEWTLNAASAGPVTLNLGYANGTTVARPMDITVNGTLVADEKSFNSTGTWDAWATAAVSASLNAGANTVRATATTTAGGPNLDYLDVVAAPPPTTTVEAESVGNTFGGTVASSACSTCSGGAKVRFIGSTAANALTVNAITAASAGTRQLTIQYLLDGTRSFFVSVNGGTAVEVALTGTSWSAPASTTLTVAVSAGTNTIRFFNDSAFAPDLDKITIS
jgi:alpha-galactosidase